MGKILKGIGIVLFIMAVIIVVQKISEAEQVFVNIWDGTQWDNIESLYSSGQLPNLQSVGQLNHLTDNQECYYNICTPTKCYKKLCTVTSTKPQHAIMLTGCLANVTGVYSNNVYQEIPDGITVFDLLKQFNQEIKTALVSSKPGNLGIYTFGNATVDMDSFSSGAYKPELAANGCINLVNNWRNDNFFIVCHFRQPDLDGHRYGVNSPQYQQAIIKDDVELGRLLNVLPLGTVVYVLADHGFGYPKLYNHTNAPNTFIVTLVQNNFFGQHMAN